MEEEGSWWSQVVLEGTSSCVMFVPHWLCPYKCMKCTQSIFKHSRETIQKEEYIQAAVESTQPGPSKILSVDEASLYHGGYRCITSRSIMKEKGIEYVCNTAKGLESVFGKKFIAARKNHEENGIEFLDLQLNDSPQQKIEYQLIEQALLFIHRALHVHKKSILVNCAQGKSRSATIVVAYLMATEDIEYVQALAKVKKQRAMAHPNIGFARQLKEWKRSGEFNGIKEKLAEIA